MFFSFKIPSSPEPEPKSVDPEINKDGEPKYIQMEDAFIINDPELLLSKEVSTEPPTKEDIKRVMKFSGHLGWIPLTAFREWATQ